VLPSYIRLDAAEAPEKPKTPETKRDFATPMEYLALRGR